MWKFKRVLSIFLIVTFICVNMPINVLAQGVDDLVNKIVPVTQSQEKSRTETTILKEVEEKREKFTKHFINSDGTFQAIVYPLAVHYQNNGKWENIDNNIIAGKDEKNNDVLENKNNAYKVRFGKRSDAEKLVSIKKDGYEISWNINTPSRSKENILNSDATTSQITVDANTVNAENSTSTVENNTVEPVASDVQETAPAEQTTSIEGTTGNSELVQESATTQTINKNLLRDVNITSVQIQPKDTDYLNKLSEEDKKKTLTNLTSTVEFKDIYQDIDLQYEVRPEDVKETIVINKNTENTYFEFNINAKDLTAKLQADKSIVFYDVKNPSKKIFAMDAPYMIDAKNQHSNDIEVGLTQTMNGYILSLKPNKEWLDSNERVYPIKLDPTVTTNLGITSIQDTFVSSSQPDTNYYNNQYLETGYGSLTAKTRTYMKFILPTLTSADMVVNAELGLILATQNANVRQVNAYKASGDWSSTTLKWNNQPGYDWTVVQDFQMVQNVNEYSWDVTAAVKDWYNTGNNYGIVLQHENEGPDCGYNNFYSSDTTIEGIRPRITIQYVNNSGLEGYWTYHSQSVGRAGTGYVNDYNGNLIFVHNDLSMNGNKMPVSINHVFNSNDKNPNNEYGIGWRLNLSQRIEYKPLGAKNYYIYTDSDGTKHYFENIGTFPLKDESGLDLSLTKNADSTYVIKDKSGNTLNFLSSGYLHTIKDNNGNALTLSYSGTTLAFVTDGAGRKTTLITNAQGKLSEIRDPSNRITKFEYTGDTLTKITYPDAKITTYVYDSNKNLTDAKNYDGYKMKYMYYPASPYRVQQIHESNTPLPESLDPVTYGQGINIKYGFNTTTYNDFRGKKNIYQFNDLGNTISIRDDEGNALYYKYYEPDSSKKNKLQLESKLQKSVMNLLKNHNAEANRDWTSTTGAGSAGSSAYSTAYKYLGNQSLSVNKTNMTDRQYYSQTLSLVKGKTYTLSSYIKTDNVENKNTKGAAVFVKYKDVTGTDKFSDSEYVTGTKDWDRYEVTFTLPIDAASTTVYVGAGIVEEKGTAYFDCIQLEEGKVANRYNLIENPNFIYGASTPDFWTKNYECTTSDTLTTSYDATYPVQLDSSKKIFRLTGVADKRKNLAQSVKVSGGIGDTFVLGGWAKGYSAAIKDNRIFAIDVELKNAVAGGASQWVTAKFNPDSTDWQYVSDKFIANIDYSSMNFYILYYENENYADFDGLQLYKEEFGQSYDYDDNGNVKSVVNLANDKSKFEYNTNNDVIKYISPKGYEFKYEYDTKRNVSKATTAQNVVYNFTHDSAGNPVTATVTSESDVNTFIQSQATYTSDGNYIKSLEDPSANTVDFNYNSTKGTLNTVTDGKNNTKTNMYDANLDRLTNTSTMVSSTTKNLELFKLDTNGVGDKGTAPVETNVSYNTTEKAAVVNNTNKLAYNFKLNKSSGTMSAWVKPGTSATSRYVFSSFRDADESLHVYIDGNNKLNVAVRNYKVYPESNWSTVITTTTNVNINAWNFIALEWRNVVGGLQLTLNLNGHSEGLKKTITEYRNFTGAKTYLGSNNGGYSINGLISNFMYSSNPLGDDEIGEIYKAGRGNYVNPSAVREEVKNSYEYTNDRISKVTHNGFDYSFLYDGLGNNTEVMVGSQSLIKNNYEPRTGKLLDSTYGNNQTTALVYDSEDRVIGRKYGIGVNTVEKFTYGYDGSGNLAYHNDIENSKNYRYDYDIADRLSKITEKDTSNSSIRNVINYGYDIENNLTNFTDSLTTFGHTSTLEYDKDRKITDIFYSNLYKNAARVEKFPLNGNSIGTLGTKPYSETAAFGKDDTGKTVLAVNSSTKLLYDLGITSENGGTLGAWFNPDISGTSSRYIISSEGKNSSVLSMYLRGDNKLVVAVREAGTSKWIDLAESTAPVSLGQWHYGAFSWRVETDTQGIKQLKINLCLDDVVFAEKEKASGTIIDFTGATTAVGGHNSGQYQMIGKLEQFSYYSKALTVSELETQYAKGRGASVKYTYKADARLEKRSIKTGVSNTEIATTYEYDSGKVVNAKVSDTTTVKKITTNGKTISYTRDGNGNIETIIQDGKIIRYYYNELSELIREDNEVLNKTATYSYDKGGNINSKVEYPYTADKLGTVSKTYSYAYGDANWKDKLTSFDGKQIKYYADDIGNPETYDGWTFTWEHGRQLAGMNGNGKVISFKYNDSGIRTQKTVNGVTTNYHLVGGKVTYEDNGEDRIYYSYDASEHLISMNLSTKNDNGTWTNGEEYFYIRNAQGDIIGLCDKSGAEVVSYSYDSFGKLTPSKIESDDVNDVEKNGITGSLATTVGVKNPYLYRGYRFDSETGLYYLQSRYYNPNWGRFLNADAIIGSAGELLGHNIFAYCKNNVVNGKDPSGFITIYTEGEATDEMVEAGYKAMNTAAKNRSAKANLTKKSVAQRGLEQSLDYIANSKAIGEEVAKNPYARAGTGIINTAILVGVDPIKGAFITSSQYVGDAFLEDFGKPQTLYLETSYTAQGGLIKSSSESARYFGMMLLWDEVGAGLSNGLSNLGARIGSADLSGLANRGSDY